MCCNPVFQEFLRNHYHLHLQSRSTSSINYAGLQEEMDGVIYAIRNNTSGWLNFYESNERELWNTLLKSNQSTHRLKAKLMSLFLELCEFALCGSDEKIQDSEWGNDGPHHDGKFEGDICMQTADYDLILIIRLDFR